MPVCAVVAGTKLLSHRSQNNGWAKTRSCRQSNAGRIGQCDEFDELTNSLLGRRPHQRRHGAREFLRSAAPSCRQTGLTLKGDNRIHDITATDFSQLLGAGRGRPFDLQLFHFICAMFCANNGSRAFSQSVQIPCWTDLRLLGHPGEKKRIRSRLAAAVTT
jgi:hypothetical protein